MFPTLFEIGTFKVGSYGVLLMIGFLIAIYMASRRAERFGLAAQQVQDASVVVILAGILGARILFIAQEWPKFAGRPDQIFKLQMDGLTSFGGLIGGVIGILLYARWKKIHPVAFLDTVGVPMLVASAIGRVGCLLHGCCFGFPCASPPGVPMAGQTGFFFPAQLVDSVLLALGAWLIVRMEKKDLPRGASVALVLVAWGIARFIFEWFRAGFSSTYWGNLPITEAHAAALAMAVGGAIWYFRVRSRSAQSLA